jgi:hypothetical protein
VSDRDDKFAWGADTLLTQCLLCKHLAGGHIAACAAFPGAIPPEILANDFDHRRPWLDPRTGRPGDMGIPLVRSITFEPRDGINPATLERLYGHLDSIEPE